MLPRTRTLLGVPPRAMTFCIASLLVTAAIVLYQLHLRTSMGDVSALSIFYHLYLVHDYPAAVLGIAVLLVGLLPALQKVALKIVDAIGEHPVLTVGLAGVGMAAGALWVYRAYPLCMDEYAPYLQAKVFAAGRLTGELPPDLVDWLVVPGFQGAFLHVSHATGAVASAYLPGFALLLAPFAAIGAPWLANPLVGAFSLFVIYRVTVELFGSKRVAGAAVFFALASPALVVNAFSFYSMPAHLLCNSVFALLLIRPTPGRALCAGLVGGLATVLHNPAPHILFALPWLGWLVMSPDRIRLLLALTVGYAPWLIVAFGWQHVVGSLDHAQAASDGQMSAGVAGWLAGALERVLVVPSEGLLAARMVGLSKVWIWAVPGLIILAGAGFWRHRADNRVRLLLASAVLTLVGYLFVPFDQGHGWGFRYFHSAWFVLPILAAGALTHLGKPGSAMESTDGLAAQSYVMAVALTAGVILTGYFAWRVHGFISDHLAQLPRAESGEPRLIIVDPTWGYYAFDLVQNDPFMREPVITALTQGPERDQQMVQSRFPSLVRLHGDFRGTVWGRPAPPPK